MAQQAKRQIVRPNTKRAAKKVYGPSEDVENEARAQMYEDIKAGFDETAKESTKIIRTCYGVLLNVGKTLQHFEASDADKMTLNYVDAYGTVISISFWAKLAFKARKQHR